jgi:hypothetical protein
LSYSIVSFISFSSLSPIPLFPVHNSTIIAEYNVQSSLYISRWHDRDLTQSTAYIEYNIHRVQHTPSTLSTVQHPPEIVWLPFILMITS